MTPWMWKGFSKGGKGKGKGKGNGKSESKGKSLGKGSWNSYGQKGEKSGKKSKGKEKMLTEKEKKQGSVTSVAKLDICQMITGLQRGISNKLGRLMKTKLHRIRDHRYLPHLHRLLQVLRALVPGHQAA